MTPTLEEICLEEFRGGRALRVDFSSDHHCRVVIKQPHGCEQVAEALRELAVLAMAVQEDEKRKVVEGV